MFSDWKIHPDSVNAYHTGIYSHPTPPLGSTNQFRVTSTIDSTLKRLIYVNRLAQSVNGHQELQTVLRFGLGNTDLRIGVFMMWDLLDFTDTDNAYVLELSRYPTDSGANVRLRNGTGRASDTLVSAALGVLTDQWVQYALQVKFDQQFNSEIRVYISDPTVNPVTAPVWTLAFGPIVIPRADSKASGQFGFFVESQQAAFTSYIDHVVMNTTLTI